MKRTTQLISFSVPGVGTVTYPKGHLVNEVHEPHVPKSLRKHLKAEPTAEATEAAATKPTRSRKKS